MGNRFLRTFCLAAIVDSVKDLCCGPLLWSIADARLTNPRFKCAFPADFEGDSSDRRCSIFRISGLGQFHGLRSWAFLSDGT